MEKYDVYLRSDLPVLHPKRCRAVRQGFAWTPFLLGFLSPLLILAWAGIKGMWKHILVSVAFLVGLILVVAVTITMGHNQHSPQAIGEGAGICVGIGYWLLSGFMGNDWYRASLLSRGYKRVFEVFAGSSDQAVEFAKNELAKNQEKTV